MEREGNSKHCPSSCSVPNRQPTPESLLISYELRSVLTQWWFALLFALREVLATKQNISESRLNLFLNISYLQISSFLHQWKTLFTMTGSKTSAYCECHTTHYWRNPNISPIAGMELEKMVAEFREQRESCPVHGGSGSITLSASFQPPFPALWGMTGSPYLWLFYNSSTKSLSTVLLYTEVY